MQLPWSTGRVSEWQLLDHRLDVDPVHCKQPWASCWPTEVSSAASATLGMSDGLPNVWPSRWWHFVTEWGVGMSSNCTEWATDGYVVCSGTISWCPSDAISHAITHTHTYCFNGNFLVKLGLSSSPWFSYNGALHSFTCGVPFLLPTSRTRWASLFCIHYDCWKWRSITALCVSCPTSGRAVASFELTLQCQCSSQTPGRCQFQDWNVLVTNHVSSSIADDLPLML